MAFLLKRKYDLQLITYSSFYICVIFGYKFAEFLAQLSAMRLSPALFCPFPAVHCCRDALHIPIKCAVGIQGEPG